MNDFALRPADERDVEVLIDVLLSSNSDEANLDASAIEYCKKRVLTEIRGEISYSIIYVVERGGERIGRLRLVETDKELFIGGIQLLPKYRGLGLGSSILRSLIDQASEANKCLWLEVEKSNHKAKKLYLKLGFTVEQDLEDEEIMIKLIEQSIEE